MNRGAYFTLATIWTMLFFSQAVAQWVSVSVSYFGLMPRVFFVDQNKGWVLGGNFGVEFIGKTIDGGKTWLEQTSGGSGKLLDGYFADSLRGWAVGDYLKIIRTTDGGRTWTDQRWGDNWYDTFAGVSFVSSELGWVAGTVRSGDMRPVVFHTTNGGLTWQEQQQQHLSAHGGLTSIKFVNAEFGWAVGWITDSNFSHPSGLLVRTTDGGAHWLSDSTGLCEEFFSVDFVSTTEGWAVGRSGAILHTTDGGISWEQQSSGTNLDLLCVAFATADSGWIGGLWGTLLTTTNRGLVWTQQSSPTNCTINSLQFLQAREGWGSTDCVLIHTSNGGVTFISPQHMDVIPTEYYLAQNYPNPFNPSTTIQFHIPITSVVTVKVFDLLGRDVATLVSKRMSPGFYEQIFRTEELRGGVYICRLQAGGFTQSRKLLLLK